MITVNIRYIRIQNVDNAGSVNIGTTLNIVAQPEGKKGEPAPTPPQSEAPPSLAPPESPTSPPPTLPVPPVTPPPAP